MPLWQKLLAVFVLLSAMGTAGFYVLQHQREERRQAQIGVEWRAFGEAAGNLDAAAMIVHLDKIEQLNPGDPLVKRRRDSLASAKAETQDQVMVVYWMNRHWADKKTAEAVLAAHQRIETVSNDWQAHCILRKKP